MTDITHKNHFKIDGLNHARRFEQDKIRPSQADLEMKLRLQQEEEKLKRTLYGRLDPTHMEFNLPEPVVDSGGVSFDPTHMTFNGELEDD